MAKQRVPALEGWFTMDEQNPRLVGLKDNESGTYFFPKDVSVSRAPGHADAALEEVELSNTGKLWSYTTNHYLGQLAPNVDPASLEVGMEMQLVLGTLYEDDENEYVVWKWKPAAA
jgi:uncharacterized OB-fold protein